MISLLAPRPRTWVVTLSVLLHLYRWGSETAIAFLIPSVPLNMIFCHTPTGGISCTILQSQNGVNGIICFGTIVTLVQIAAERGVCRLRPCLSNHKRLPTLNWCTQVEYGSYPKSQGYRNSYHDRQERLHVEDEGETYTQSGSRASQESPRLSKPISSSICNLNDPTVLQGYPICTCLYLQLLCYEPLSLSRVLLGQTPRCVAL